MAIERASYKLDKVNVVAAPVRQRVAEVIRNAIINLTLKPGDRLIERELCEMTGVSRTSLRESLRELEAEGLVQNVPYKGLVVATVSVEEARNIYAVRSQLEGLLGREAALKRTDRDIRDLRENFAKVEKVVAARRYRELVTLKSEFYAILMRVTANPTLSDIVTNLQGRVAQFRATVMTREERAGDSLEEMKRIIEAIERQDPVEAEAACTAHVRNASDVLIEMLVEATHKKP